MTDYIVSYTCSIEYSLYITTGKAFVTAENKQKAIERALLLNNRIIHIERVELQ